MEWGVQSKQAEAIVHETSSDKSLEAWGSADISIWLYYGVGKGRSKGMDGGVNRRKVMECPACHNKSLLLEGIVEPRKDLWSRTS